MLKVKYAFWLCVLFFVGLCVPAAQKTFQDYRFKTSQTGGKMILGTSQHISMLLADGRVLVTGGDHNSNGVDRLQLYDPETDSWRQLPRLPDRVFVHAAAQLKDGSIYIGGGFNGTKKFMKEAWIFDLNTQKIKPAPDLLEARDNQRFTLLNDGRVFMAGGDNEEPNYVKSSEYFNPHTFKNEKGPDFPYGRAMGSVTLLQDGTIFVTGGITADGENIRYLSGAYIVDPLTNTLETVDSLQFARKQFTATLLADGRVLVAGGINEDGTLKSTEIFDPKTRRFTRGPDMTMPRYGHTATLMASGKVLITGGHYSDGQGASLYLDTAEIFDPEKGTFTAVGPMRFPRMLHSALLLKNGDVLIMGGYYYGDREYEYPARCEIFSTAEMKFR